MNDYQASLLITAHVLASILFFAINLRFKGFQDSLYKFCIVFFLPVAGLAYFLVSFILSRFKSRTDSMVESYIKYIKEEKHIYYEEAVDFEKEMNTVPMDDSLNFSSDKVKREYLIYILKKDFSRHVKGLKKAVKSADTETSHYSAAALMEIKKQYEVLLSDAGDEYKRNGGDFKVLQNYSLLLKKYLKSGLADKIDYASYLEKYSEVLSKILKENNSEETNFIDKINSLIELLDGQGARDYCDLFLKRFPDSENPYILLMKLYYHSGEPELFKTVLDALKEKKKKLSEHSESIVKFWEAES